MRNQSLIETITLIADTFFDGHFILMKFTTEWRLAFGTPHDLSYDDVKELPCGPTLKHAFIAAVRAAHAHVNHGNVTAFLIALGESNDQEI